MAFREVLDAIRSRPLVRDAVSTTALSTIGRAIAFLVPFFIAAWFGVSSETDAFFFAFGLVIFLVTIFSPVVEGVIVPFISEIRVDKADAGEFVGRVICMSGVGLTLIALAFVLVSKPVLPLFTKFPDEGQRLIFMILLEIVPLVVLLVWTSILSGALNAYKVFGVPAVSPAFRAAATLLFIFLFKDSLGVHAIGIGYVVGETARLVMLALLISRLNVFKIKFSFGWEKRFNEFFRTSSYQIIGMSILAFNPIINKAFASTLAPGSVSLLEYADRLYSIPGTLLVSGLMVALLSHWSERFHAGGMERLRKDVIAMFKLVGVFCVMLTVFLFLTRVFWVNMVYGAAMFDHAKITAISSLFGLYILGMSPYILVQVFVRAFLTVKETRRLLHAAYFAFAGNIIFNLLLIKPYGVYGIAFATTLVGYLCLAVLAVSFFRYRHKERTA